MYPSQDVASSIGNLIALPLQGQGELAESRGMLVGTDMNNRPKPWKKKCEFVKTDVVGKLHMVLSNGVYIDTLNLMPRIQNPRTGLK